ncbi:MAG: endonuclease III [Bacteroidaceae bacterium]
MKKQELYRQVLNYFERIMPPTDTELNYQNPFELLVAVILSAQCTDKRINKITPKLFEDFPTPEVMAETSQEVLFEYIRSVSYPNNKAKHLVGMAQMLVNEFKSEVPEEHDSLTKLPGVGRKTANVIQAIIFGKAALAVDTHVYRVSRRLGLVPLSCNTPFKVEKELMRNIPTEKVASAHFWLLYHGRYTCLARTPKCDLCELKMLCEDYKKRNKLKPITTKTILK